MSKFKVGDRVRVAAGATDSSGWRDPDMEKERTGVITASDEESVRVAPDDEDMGMVFFPLLKYVTLIEEGNVNESNPELDGVWATYHQENDGFVVFTVHETEIDALRYAVKNKANVKRLGYGEELVP